MAGLIAGKICPALSSRCASYMLNLFQFDFTFSHCHSGATTLKNQVIHTMHSFPGYSFRLPILILPLLLLGACSDKPAPREDAIPGVMVTKASIQSVKITSEFIARTEAVNDVDIRSRVQGYLLERRFIEGEDVEIGDVLFVIDPETYEAAVAQQKATVEKAKSEAVRTCSDLDKYEKLYKTKTISEQDILKARSEKSEANASLAAAQASLSIAQSDLRHTEITAPIRGRIGRSLASVGNLIDTSSGALARLVELDPIYVSFGVSERDLISIKNLVQEQGLEADAVPEIEVTLRLPDDEIYPTVGRLDFVDNVVDSNTGTVRIRAKFANPNQLLVPGLFVHAMVGRETKTQALVIPEQAIQEDQAGAFVMVVDTENKVDIRRVKTGRSEDGWLKIEEGLEDGEMVVVEGVQKVRPGMTVTTKVAPLAIQQGG